ncbi:MAG: F0F1 ATP synthase subunit B [Erysipelotrichales bacterium]|nr:F0F1 ATP synthase subunit B [Erysipelotrichales bacterium]
MELGIDIQGQLFPNLVTMIVQLTSTAILLYFVKKFLWGPALNFLAQRAEYAQSQITQAEELKSEAEKLNSEAKQKVKEAGATARDLIEDAKRESSQVKEALMKEAKAEAEAKLDAARREIEYEKKAMREDITKEIVDVALAATEKLLADKTTDEDDRKAIEKFVKDVNA